MIEKNNNKRLGLNEVKTKLVRSHSKVLASIDSCETFEQLDSACNMADNFRLLCMHWADSLKRRKDVKEYVIYATDLLNDIIDSISYKQGSLKQIAADLEDSPAHIMGFNNNGYPVYFGGIVMIEEGLKKFTRNNIPV